MLGFTTPVAGAAAKVSAAGGAAVTIMATATATIALPPSVSLRFAFADRRDENGSRSAGWLEIRSIDGAAGLRVAPGPGSTVRLLFTTGADAPLAITYHQF